MRFPSDMPYTTDLAPGEGADTLLQERHIWAQLGIGGDVVKCYKRAVIGNPAMKAAIAAKVRELEAQGFFAAHPPREVHLEAY